MRFCWLGPSPFHADILITLVDDQADPIIGEGTARGRGYAFLLFKIRNDHLRSEIDSFIHEFDTLLGCYYSIIHRRNEGITIEQRILNCASNLCEHPSGVWQLIRRRTIPTRRHSIDEAFAALLRYKMHNIEITAYIAEQKRQEVINEKGLLYPILERTIEESNPLPMEEVRDILKIAEDRHQRLIANTTTLLAGLTGAAIGAGLTYLLTRTGSLGLDWMMFL